MSINMTKKNNRDYFVVYDEDKGGLYEGYAPSIRSHRELIAEWGALCEWAIDHYSDEKVRGLVGNGFPRYVAEEIVSSGAF